MTGRSPFSQLPRHPAVWDELAVLPLPGLVSLLGRCLQLDAAQTIPYLGRIAANPFQRWAVQKALLTWLHSEPNPLSSVYQLCQHSVMDAYFSPPVGPRFFRDWPTTRELLLAEMGQVNVRDRQGENMDHWVWRLTYRLRHKAPGPLPGFASFLYWLFRWDEWLGQAPFPDLLAAFRERDLQQAYRGVAAYPHGPEIVLTFDRLGQGLAVTTIEEIAALAWGGGLPGEGEWLRPPVMAVLQGLAEIRQELAVTLAATSRGQQANGLIRANGGLQELAGYISQTVRPPEQLLLARLVDHWQGIIAKAQGKLGAEVLQAMSPQMRREAGLGERHSAAWQRPVKPFDNPYIAGDPVYPPLLVGRSDIFNRIGEIWGAKSNPDSIILYGHRRMGKSSILRNLAQAAPAQTVIAYADMQGKTSFVASTASLLLELADEIVLAFNAAHPAHPFPQPAEADYSSAERAQRAFNLLTAQVRQRLAPQSLILALDEFEAVEKAVAAGKIGPEIYQFLRSKSMEPGLTLVFGGLHTLDEMSRDYQQPFFGSYTNVRVSYLSHQEAWRLITNPNEAFRLNYDPAAVERIIAATGGQPYLVQLVCREALDHLNHTLFDQAQEREVRLTLADVEAVLGGSLFQRGMVYFDGVWSQAGEASQKHLLRVMAGRPEPWSWEELLVATRLDETTLRRALRWAERQDILDKVGERPQWQFYVPLLRQWIKTRRR